MNTEMTNWDYVRAGWADHPARKRKWFIFFGIVVALWLAGFAAARPLLVQEDTSPLLALIMGPMGLVWRFLVDKDILDAENKLLIVFCALWGGIVFLVGKIFSSPMTEENHIRYEQERQHKAQGRLTDSEAIKTLKMDKGIPLALARIDKKNTQAIGLDYENSEGHVLVVGNTRSGKGLHLTQTLLQWPGAAVVVDPKAEQYERTAGHRSRLGPIFRIPGDLVHLAGYYDYLMDADAVSELHYHLLRPWTSKEPIFANKSKVLFTAAGKYAKQYHLNPIRVLLDAAACDATAVLTALETVAKDDVRRFTDGLPPKRYTENKLATSAYGSFSTALEDYQKHLYTISPTYDLRNAAVPEKWASQKGTIYITYSLADLNGVGPVVGAMIAGLMRYQMKKNRHDRMLVAIDELPAVGIANIDNYLSTVGGYGITMLLYAQAFSQLKRVYGENGAQTIITNCTHQVWYPPKDIETARIVSDIYGTELKATRVRNSTRRLGDPGFSQGISLSLQSRPVFEPTAVTSLSEEKVIVQMQKRRLYRFLGERLNPIHLFEKLPLSPVAVYSKPPAEREYVQWAASDADGVSGGQGDTGQEGGNDDGRPPRQFSA